MTTLTTIASHIADVTSDQVGKCLRIYDFQKKEWFYIVESEQDSSVEYHVRFSRQHGFTCSCKAGEYGFAGVKHPSGVCKHVRWAVAAAREERAAAAEIAAEQVEEVKKEEAPVLIVDGAKADQATLDRVMNAKAKPVGKAKAYQPKAFSLLK